MTFAGLIGASLKTEFPQSSSIGCLSMISLCSPSVFVLIMTALSADDTNEDVSMLSLSLMHLAAVSFVGRCSANEIMALCSCAVISVSLVVALRSPLLLAVVCVVVVDKRT